MADNAVPYNVMGNIQDKSSFRGPSRTGGGRGGMGVGNWIGTGGCEDAYAVPDPVDSDVVWSGCDNGRVVRIDYKHGMARDVSAWPITSYGWAPGDMKYRWDWVTPIAISPQDHNRVYVGAQVVFMTSNGGQSWKVISPDLTTNDKSHEGNSGGISSDNLTTFDGATLYAIAESPMKAGVIWTGSTDGQVNVTQDAGAHWTNVTKNIANLPPWGTVWSIAPSKFDAGTAYVVDNLQHQGIYDALVYKTTDYGATWKLISSSVPKSVNSSAHIIVEDPVRRGMLYLGTDNALYVTWDDGGQWTRVRNDLPPAPVYWMQVQPTFNDLVIATHGRGVYILDDVTPLRTWDTAQTEAVHLFPPRPAYRFRGTADARESEPDAHVNGENPPYGADINFSLQSGTPGVEVSIVGPGNAIICIADRRRPPGPQSHVVGPALRKRFDDHDADAAAWRAMGAGPAAVRGVWDPDSARRTDRAAGRVHSAREGRSNRADGAAHGAARSEVAGDPAIDRGTSCVLPRRGRRDR